MFGTGTTFRQLPSLKVINKSSFLAWHIVTHTKKEPNFHHNTSENTKLVVIFSELIGELGRLIVETEALVDV